jgi:hypothetical protein
MKPIEALFESIPPRENGLVNVIIRLSRAGARELSRIAPRLSTEAEYARGAVFLPFRFSF